MSTYDYACNQASKIAKEKGQWMYVVEEPWEAGGWADYFSATDEDLETFFYGCSVVMTFGPDGNPEY